MEGVAALVHMASPFVIDMPKDEQVLIRPAVQGTRRALEAAARAGVKRVVLTSSIVAIETPGRHEALDESNWLDMTSPTADPYGKSKALAEREAWKIAGREGLALTTINPAWVLGPPLDTAYGTSVELIARVLRGRDPMVPDVGFALVDVRDVAEMHLRALERPETAGKRFLAVGGKMTLTEMAQALKAAYPKRRIPTRAAPLPLLRVLALFDRQIRTSLPRIGWMPGASSARAMEELGMEFIPAEESLLASADFLVTSGRV
jgi:dihydroflavonol-4-reductase